MSDFITLSCPSCGGRLEITKDMDRFVCAHCGNEQIVRRAGGTISLAPVMAGLQKIQASTDRVGAELAIQRLTRDLVEAEGKSAAAKTKLEAAVKADKLKPSAMPAIALAIIILGGTLLCGAFTLLLAATKSSPALFVAIFLAGVIASAGICGLAVIRQLASNKLSQAHDAANVEFTKTEAARLSIQRERDKTRTSAGL